MVVFVQITKFDLDFCKFTLAYASKIPCIFICLNIFIVQGTIYDKEVGLNHQTKGLKQLVILFNPDLDSHLATIEESYLYFSSRWLSVMFKHEFSSTDILRYAGNKKLNGNFFKFKKHFLRSRHQRGGI